MVGMELIKGAVDFFSIFFYLFDFPRQQVLIFVFVCALEGRRLQNNYAHLL